MTFDPACVSTKTKTGRFLTNKVPRQPFAKRQSVPKQFNRKYQTYIKVTICGNMFGVRKCDHFVKYFREMLVVLMAFEPRLVIIPYTDGATSKKRRPFANECSMLSSSYQCQIYVNKIFIGEGKPTTVKLFVGHGIPSAVFNSLEFSPKADELDGAVRMCFVQARKVVVAGYLVGSSKTLDNIHWTNHYDCHPRLLKMDVQVKTRNIEDPTGETQKWSPRNQVQAAHILCAEKNEKDINIQMGNMYNKVRKASRVAGEFPEARAMRYVPYKATNIITQPPNVEPSYKKND